MEALERKPGTTGGPAGQASNALHQRLHCPDPMLKFVRNPPHVFGTGYVVGLAEKMTLDLLTQKVAAYVAAALSPGTEISVDLHSTDTKGRPVVQFGNFQGPVYRQSRTLARPDGAREMSLSATPTPTSPANFVEDVSGVAGRQPGPGRPPVAVEGNRVQRAELRPVGHDLSLRHAAPRAQSQLSHAAGNPRQRQRWRDR